MSYFASGKALKHKKVFHLGAFHCQQNNKNIGGEEYSLQILKVIQRTDTEIKKEVSITKHMIQIKY